MDTDSLQRSGESAKSIFHGIGDAAQAEGARIDTAITRALKRVDTAYAKAGQGEEKTAGQLKAAQESLQTLLVQYATYTEQRTQIEKKFNDDIAAMRAENADGSLTKNIEQAESQKETALSKLDFEEQKKGLDFTRLLGDLDNLALPSMKSLRDKIKEWIDGAGQSLSSEDLKAVSGAFNNLELKISEKDPFGTLVRSLKEVFSAGGKDGNTKKNLTALGKTASASANMIGSLAGDLSGMFEAVGAEKLAGAMKTVQGVMSAVSNISEGFVKGGLTGGISAAIGETVKGITELFKAKDKRKEKEIQLMQEQVDALQKSYDGLGESIDKAYSADAATLIGDQNKMLEQQKALIKNQIATERSKKNADDDKVDAWQEQINQIDKTLGQNKERALDAIFGEDLKSAIENFATAYADAWAKGEDRSRSAKDTVRLMMRQMVTESIKAAVQSSQAMEDIRKKLEEFYADKVLTGWEQDYIYDMAGNLQKELDDKFGWADSLIGDEDPASRESAGRGIATASQESVDENNGRLTAIQGHTYSLCEGMRLLQPDVSGIRMMMSEMTGNAARQLMVMQGIETNTRSLVRLERIESDMGAVKNTLNDINLKGLKIR